MTSSTSFPVPLGRALALGLLLLGAAGPARALLVHPVAVAFDRLGTDAQVAPEPTAELHCLALNVYHEARNEPDEGRFAVAAVTMNRVRDGRFPASVCGVVWQRGQFSWTRDGKPDKPYNARAWEDALWIARLVYEYGHASPVGSATHYHAVYVSPRWASRKRLVRRVGRHLFYESVRG